MNQWLVTWSEKCQLDFFALISPSIQKTFPSYLFIGKTVFWLRTLKTNVFQSCWAQSYFLTRVELKKMLYNNSNNNNVKINSTPSLSTYHETHTVLSFSCENSFSYNLSITGEETEFQRGYRSWVTELGITHAFNHFLPKLIGHHLIVCSFPPAW